MSTISKFDAEVRAQVNIICKPDTDGKDAIRAERDKDNTSSIGEHSQWNNNSENTELSVREQLTAAVNSRPWVTLYSHKMAALKPLLLSERVNTHALQLQLTAQSQLQRPPGSSKKRQGDSSKKPKPTARAKRARRER